MLSLEFPHEASREALSKIARLFADKLTRLESMPGSTDSRIILRECERSLHALVAYMPIAGFLLRSTNVRNAFEVAGPLRRLASALLEPGAEPKDQQVKVILSSEWEYSPYTYRNIGGLLGVVLIGFPSSESSNPLLVPLAGHELGHSLWYRRNLADQYRLRSKGIIITEIGTRWDEYRKTFPDVDIAKSEVGSDLFAMESWQMAEQWALRQIEETYCDLIGLLLFGQSFLEAFRYLLSPRASERRSPSYPSLGTRIANLVRAARDFGVGLPEAFEESFVDDGALQLGSRDTFRLSLADHVLSELFCTLELKVREDVESSGVAVPTSSGCSAVLERLRVGSPPEGCHALGDIINAAWFALNEPDLWIDTPEMQAKRELMLHELALKSIEVFDTEAILRGEP